jgi:uncharacterized protein YggU (UPF0235/DUF167 family)
METRLVRVRVTPGARREKVAEEKGVLHISVKEPAEGGAANARVRELVALRYGVAPKSLRLVKGARSTHKTFSISS